MFDRPATMRAPVRRTDCRLARHHQNALAMLASILAEPGRIHESSVGAVAIAGCTSHGSIVQRAAEPENLGQSVGCTPRRPAEGVPLPVRAYQPLRVPASDQSCSSHVRRSSSRVMGHPSLQSSSAGTCSTGSPLAHAVVTQPTAAGAPQPGHLVQVIRSLTPSPSPGEDSTDPLHDETTIF